MNRLPPLIALLLVASAPLSAADDATRAQHAFFENEIRPLLANRCYECHGAKKQKGGLRLDRHVFFKKGGESGAVVTAGKPDESPLIEAVRRKNPDFMMPPEDPLPPAEVALLEKWVALGAPWPSEPEADLAGAAATDENGFTAEQRNHWAFQPLASPPAPAPSPAASRWVRGDIDRFVAAKHAELKLTPAPEADRREFVRRIYFDVHGLPPTREQTEAFVGDARPDAVERLVDALLASPRYGERWAQHWLDVVRYAEGDGYRADEYRPGAWPYRDYVIKSLNADKPYDQFVREQLSADEIAPDRPDVLIATGYLRNGIYEWNQADVRTQAETILTDLTDNAGEVFLGLSMGCARCHDHKFDPILQKDYFALRAFFEPVLWRTDLALATAEEQAAHAAKMKPWEEATAALRREREALFIDAQNLAVKRIHERFPADIQAMLEKPAVARTPQEHVLVAIAQRQLDYEVTRFEPLKSIKSPAGKARFQAIEAELKKLAALKPEPLLPALVATDVGPLAPPTQMKGRKSEREIAPAFLTLLEPKAPAIAPRGNSTGRRTALADWIARPDNPLSTRVIVNRVWQHHFGRGLVATPNDFGKLGEKPSHPELLDFLARKFVAGGWSLKALHREILLSATYRQTARVPVAGTAALVDASNKFLWRHSPRRLDAEQARDAILAATGELDLSLGGASQDAATSSRRSIYTIKKRNNPNELLRALDAPPGFTGIADRQNTATPLQALLFLNGDWMLGRARKLAATASSIDDAWQAALGRPPASAEAQLARSFLAQRAGASVALIDSLQKEPLRVPPSGMFHESTPQERVVTRGAPREGDDFTVEALVTLDSVDPRASVRTIASRWNGEKNSLEAHGWSLGVTGEKSPLKPRHLILQIVGEDENTNTTYEALSSGIQLELGRQYHVAVRFSSTDRTAQFTVLDLPSPESAPRTATVRHNVVGKVATGTSQPVIGGLARRSPHQFDGQIAALRIVAGVLPDDALSDDPTRWSGDGMVWKASAPTAPGFTWAGDAGNSESADPRERALADLAHVLLNSNEFLHLH